MRFILMRSELMCHSIKHFVSLHFPLSSDEKREKQEELEGGNFGEWALKIFVLKMLNYNNMDCVTISKLI